MQKLQWCVSISNYITAGISPIKYVSITCSLYLRSSLYLNCVASEWRGGVTSIIQSKWAVCLRVKYNEFEDIILERPEFSLTVKEDSEM